MARAKKSNNRDIFASVDNGDYFGTLYDGMLRHKNYKRLSIGAKHFYTLCRVQARSKRGTSCLYQHGAEYGTTYPANCFVFPAAHLKEYEIDRSNAKRYFDELINAGFIQKYEANKTRKKVNVYAFANKWKNDT